MFEVDKGIQPYWFIGQVVDNNDFANANRVKVRCLGVHPDAPGLDPNPNDKTEKDTVYDEDLPWAHLINGTYGKLEMIPDINDWVFGFFADGRECQHPYVLGLLSGMGTDVTGLTPECAPGAPSGTTGGAGGVNGAANNFTPNPTNLGKNAKERLEALKNDPEFQAYLDTMIEKYPGLTKEDIYAIAYGESGFNPQKIAEANGLYGGLFQLGQASVGLDPNYVASLSPTDQLKLYDQFLSTSANYRGGGLGMYQAAPGVLSNYYRDTGQIAPDNLVLYVRNEAHRKRLNALGYNANYAYSGFGDVVYNQNSAGGKFVTQVGTVWVDNNDAITAGSVNSYYRKFSGL